MPLVSQTNSMRLTLILLLFAGLSCTPTATIKNKLAATNKPVNAAKGWQPDDNHELWQKIVERPDSVSLAIAINDTIGALLTLYGRLDSVGYLPDSLSLKLTNGTKQAFRLTGSVMLWQESQQHPFVSLQDLNFDGSLELALFDNAGAVSYWYSVYLFKPGAGYSYSEAYSQTPSLKIDFDQKLVTSFYRAGDCEEVIGYYKAVCDSLQPISYLYTSQETERCITYRKERENDEWKITKLGEWEVTLYDSLYVTQ